MTRNLGDAVPNVADEVFAAVNELIPCTNGPLYISIRFNLRTKTRRLMARGIPRMDPYQLHARNEQDRVAG